MRRVFTFDVDGVIVDGEYTPILERITERYRQSKMKDWKAVETLNTIAMHDDVYLISSRSCPDATYMTREWLFQHGFAVNLFAGVICNVMPERKVDICKMLYATLHFDDVPEIVKTMPKIGVLVENPSTPGNTNALIHMSHARSWAHIARWCEYAPENHISFATQQGELEL